MIVPIAVKALTLTMEWWNFFMTVNSTKNRKAVTNLSMMFGTKPPGNVVVKAEIKPVTIPRSKTFFFSGNRIIPKNIMVSIMSGFIPRKIPGITVWSAAPIPTNRERDTNVFVFISHFSSAKLAILMFLQQCSCCLLRKTYTHYITETIFLEANCFLF